MSATLRFAVAGRTTLGVCGSADVDRYVEAQMDPLRPGPVADGDAEILLRAAEAGELGASLDLQRPAGDGIVTGSDGRRLHLVTGAARCTLPDPLAERPAVFAYEPGFPIAGLFRRFVRPALGLSVLRAGAVTVHAACVEVDGGAVLLAGWSETGKTEAALALAEAGGRFLSDKWTVIAEDATAAAFPIEVGVRGWALRHLPRLRRSLPPPARLQLRLAALASGPARGLRRRSRGRRTSQLAEAIDRAVILAERAPVAPSAIRAAYGQDDDPARIVPLRAVVLLCTVPGPGVDADAAEAAWAVRRLARSAAYERRPYFALTERARFALPDRPREDLLEDVVRREQALLERALGSARLIRVRAPFPTDPRRLADAIESAL